MKKLALILAMLLVVPAAAFGLEMLDNDALDTVTGQAGVNIVFDDIELFINIDRMAYIDTDGFNSFTFIGTDAAASNSNGGALSVTNFQLDTLVINAIVSGSSATYTIPNSGGETTPIWDLASSTAGAIDLVYTYNSTASLTDLDLGPHFATAGLKGLQNYHVWNQWSATGGQAYQAKALTIDVVGVLPVTSEAMSLNVTGDSTSINIGGVLISLPTAEFYVGNMLFTPTFNDLIHLGTNPLCFNDGDNFGTILIEGMTMSVLNGWLEISPH